jgi:hypothetical protein
MPNISRFPSLSLITILIDRLKYMSELLYDWRFTSNQFILATSSLRLTTSNFFFQLNICGQSTYVTFSLTRGWVCRLQLLLVLASAVILRSESRRTHDHILLSQIRDSPNLEGQVPVFICGTHDHILLYQIRVSPNLEGQVPVFICGTHDHILLSQFRVFPNLEGQVPVFICGTHDHILLSQIRVSPNLEG